MRTPVVVLAYPDAQSLDVTGPFEVFAGADQVLEAPVYEPVVVSVEGGVVRTESGLGIDTVPIADLGPGSIHTLVVAGGRGSRGHDGDEVFLSGVRDLAKCANRVMAVCTGAFLVAAAGLADGRRVATHWAHAERLARLHPTVEVEPDAIWLRDGSLWSSAGVTAGIDLALAVVEADQGAEVAQLVARHLVVFLRRPGGQSQFAEPLGGPASGVADHDATRRACRLVEGDPAAPHTVERLAAHVGMSARHFTRCFTAATGLTPARYVTEVRLDAARRALESGDETLPVIAERCGFGTAETMRRTFGRRLGVTPDAYRRRFRLVP